MQDHLFQKKLTVMPTDKGFAVAVYGKPTGQVYSSEELAQKEIDAIKQRQKEKQLQASREKRKLEKQSKEI